MAYGNPATALLCAALIWSSGCARQDAGSKTDGTSITVTGKHGEKVTTDVGLAKVPEDYPKDIPVYSDATVNMAQNISEKNARNLMLETGDSAEKIASFYKTALDMNGWKTEGTVAAGAMHLITAAKAKRRLTIQITNANGKRSILQTIQDKP